MTDRHADTFARTEAGETTTTTAKAPQTKPAIDNADQAARAQAQREFTLGGDGVDSPPPTATPPSTNIANAIARVRAPDRPSPFGITHFPPLPKPPGVTS